MIGALQRFLRPAPPVPASSTLPAELVLEIESASVVWRLSRADDPDAMPIIWAANLGRWTWSGHENASRRVSRCYPELSEGQCLRAARLISAQLGRQNRRDFGRPRRCGVTYRQIEAAEAEFFGRKPHV